MNNKISRLCFIVGTLLATTLHAQVPSYIPTNGLAAWWGFNNNADDGSGNLNHGTVFGPTPTADRFGNPNSAYHFDGINDYIKVLSSNSLKPASAITFMAWIKPSASSQFVHAITKNYSSGHNSYVIYYITSGAGVPYTVDINPATSNSLAAPGSVPLSQWTLIACTYDGTTMNLYENGALVNSRTTATNVLGYSNNPLWMGASNDPTLGGGIQYLTGDMDDIGIWDRALTAQEIDDIYNGCELKFSPPLADQFVAKGTNAVFTTSVSVAATHQWQSNPADFGWMNVPGTTPYSGGTTNTLTVNNVQLKNHAQPFRLIVDSMGCRDTSDVVYIFLTDTCVNASIDTNYFVMRTSLPEQKFPGENEGMLVKIYPNPANGRLVIDYGNVEKMNGHTLKILNALGQDVFVSPINQQTSLADLSTQPKGLYFVHIVDSRNNVVASRKIILQ